MKNITIIVLTAFIFINAVFAQGPSSIEKARWEKHALQTKIIRDEWGIPHIYGKTDADAVFGLMYAQCEENFPQIEKNFLEMLGRQAELEGSKKLYDDLMMQLIQDSADAVKDFNNSPDWLKQLLTAHADGINYYLYKHPEVQAKVIKQFKPWYHLMWTDGSVSPTRSAGIRANDVANFYGASAKEVAAIEKKLPFEMEESTLKGSNGFAIAPMHSKNGNALLYINPHVPFYFRSEMHMNSEEGLNVYGAVTWGQMFIYQGFNEHCGWMHTSSYADVADLYEEKIKRKEGQLFYEYEKEDKKIQTRNISLKYWDNGILKTKTFETYATHHGPVMASKNNQWLSLQENNRSKDALIECWIRTKAKNIDDYKKALSLLSNNSNNTVYADAQGNIAYWHGNFMPKRNPLYDYTRPVDGSIKATDWQGIHPLEDIVQSINPTNGWLQNCNATPFTVAGDESPKASNYPAYMAPDGENGRGITAVKLLSKVQKLNIDELIQLGYNKYLSAFDILLPSFLEYAKTITLNPNQLKAIDYLAKWDKNAAINSVATSIAIEWATQWAAQIPPATTEEEGTQIIKKYHRMVNELSNEKKLALLGASLHQLEKLYGTWETPWGAINRYQRVDPEDTFNDQVASMAVAQASSKWGQLPAFESKRMGKTSKRYGFSGNSFVAVVSFGKKLEAKTIITGGQSRFSNNAHFTDQAEKYIQGDFKSIHFYKEDVLKHALKSYNPGLDK